MISKPHFTKATAIGFLRRLWRNDQMQSVSGYINRYFTRSESEAVDFEVAARKVSANIKGKSQKDGGYYFTVQFPAWAIEQIELISRAEILDRTGVIACSRSQITHHLMSVCDLAANHTNSPKRGRWLARCEEHEVECHFLYKTYALKAIRQPSSFCHECRESLIYRDQPVSRDFYADPPETLVYQELGWMNPHGLLFCGDRANWGFLHSTSARQIIRAFHQLEWEEEKGRLGGEYEFLWARGYLKIDVTEIYPFWGLTAAQVAALKTLASLEVDAAWPVDAALQIIEIHEKNLDEPSMLHRTCGNCNRRALWNATIKTYKCKHCGSLYMSHQWMQPPPAESITKVS